MRNQFIYTEEIEIPKTETAEAYTQTKKNSFNVDMVIRSITLDNGGLLVLLDDLHERTEDVRKMKNGKIYSIKEKNTFQSEIHLSKTDAERFFELTDITLNNNNE